MVEQSRDFGRIWRRTVGIGGFALFLAGLLVAMDLEELVAIAAVVGALCALAGVVTLALVRYRRALARGAATAGRATAPRVAGLSRSTGAGSRRLAGSYARASRTAGLALAAAGAETARAARAGARRTVPVLQRADHELGVRVRGVAAAGSRHAVRAVNVIAADIHAHRNAIRSSSPRAGEAVRPSPRRSPGDRRSVATPSARVQRRGRA